MTASSSKKSCLLRFDIGDSCRSFGTAQAAMTSNKRGANPKPEIVFPVMPKPRQKIRNHTGLFTEANKMDCQNLSPDPGSRA